MSVHADSRESAPKDDVTSSGTVLRLEGGDALSLVHRLSTQALLDLAPGGARAALFCDYRGRLLHRAIAARTRDGAVWLLRDDAPGSELAAHLDRHMFRDDVRIQDFGGALGVRMVHSGFGIPAGEVEESDGRPARVQVGVDSGCEIGPPAPLPSEDAERTRIASGRPRHGHEIRDEFHPFEVGLAHEIHLSKGCFTGQEVLLRLVTYGGTRRHLALVRGPGDVPVTPADLVQTGERAGRLTSAARDGSGWMGLAVLRDGIEAGLDLAGPGGEAVEVVSRFPETRPLGLP